MLQLVAEVDPWESKDISALGNDTKEARDERIRDLEKRERAGTFCGGERYIYRMRWTGQRALVEAMEVSNPLDLLEVFLRNPRNAPTSRRIPDFYKAKVATNKSILKMSI